MNILMSLLCLLLSDHTGTFLITLHINGSIYTEKIFYFIVESLLTDLNVYMNHVDFSSSFLKKNLRRV